MQFCQQPICLLTHNTIHATFISFSTVTFNYHKSREFYLCQKKSNRHLSLPQVAHFLFRHYHLKCCCVRLSSPPASSHNNTCNIFSKPLHFAFFGALAFALLFRGIGTAEAVKEKRIAQEIANLKADTGFKLRVLAQNYPNTPVPMCLTMAKEQQRWILKSSCSSLQSVLSIIDAGGRHEANIIEAFDHVIYDGVDVSSASIGGSTLYSMD